MHQDAWIGVSIDSCGIALTWGSVVGQSWMLSTVSGESRTPQTQSRLSRMLRTQSGTFQTVSVAGDCQNNAPCIFPVLWMEWITPCLCSVQHNVPDTSTVSGSSLLSHSYIYRLQRSGLIPQSYSLLCSPLGPCDSRALLSIHL